MTPREVLWLRLVSQGLSRASAESPVEVVRKLGAVQAQDYAGSLWSIGMRSAGAKLGDVERAVRDGSIVRTWPMRGTLHFVTEKDAAWMVNLLASRVSSRLRARLRWLGVSGEDAERGKRAVLGMLEGGGRPTRPEVYQRLEQEGIRTSEGRGLLLLHILAREGSVCLGPHRDRQPTLRQMPRAGALTPSDPLREVAVRYYTSHGPASLKDFTWWSGLSLMQARKGLQAAGRDLSTADMDGTPHWTGEGRPAASGSGAFLLPAFDEYFIAYKRRDIMVEPRFARRKAGSLPALFLPKVVLDGAVVGWWRRFLKRDEVRVEVGLFERLGGGKLDSVEAAVFRYAEFIGRRPVVCLSAG